MNTDMHRFKHEKTTREILSGFSHVHKELITYKQFMKTPAFKHGELTHKIIGGFFDVYNELGHGFLESVYEKSLQVALNSIGLKACRQIEIPVRFRGHEVGDFSADMLVEDCVLLELKAARALDVAHEAQLLNYLRATDIEVGLLLNFGLKPQFKRLLFDNPRKAIRENPCLSVAVLLDSND